MWKARMAGVEKLNSAIRAALVSRRISMSGMRSFDQDWKSVTSPRLGAYLRRSAGGASPMPA